MNSLQGKRVLITGGTTGIGRATALLLAAEGARVFVFGRTPHALEETLETARAQSLDVTGTLADVSDHEAMGRLFSHLETLLGGLDILVNNASLPANSVLNSDLETIEQVLRVNVLGYLLCSRWAAGLMTNQGSGHIVGVGSLCIDVLDNGADLYVCTKTAIAGFFNSLRKQVMPKGVKVTLINPGGTATDMVTETDLEQRRMIEEGRLLRPSDVAEAILFAVTRSAQVDVTELTIRPHCQSGL